MIKYLLDTNAIIAILNNQDSKIANKARAHDVGEIGISAIVYHELYYGAFKSQRKEHNLRIVDGIPLEPIEFDKEDSRSAGEIRRALAAVGTPIGPYDILIAGQAKARDLILVSRNIKEFQRIEGLKTESWEA